MANIEDLNYLSILNMGNDEAIETLRQIRLSRRVPEKKVATKASTSTIRKETSAKVDASMAAELLKLLEGSND